MDLGLVVVAGPLENDIWKPRCSHGVAKPLGTRLWTQQLIPDPWWVLSGAYCNSCSSRRYYETDSR